MKSGGAVRHPKLLDHILNTGNIEVKGKTHTSGYAGGVGTRQSTSDQMHINNSFNTGTIDLSELEIVSTTATTLHTFGIGGIIGQVPAKVHDAVIENSANYGDIICYSTESKDWKAHTYIGGITGYWLENTPGTNAAARRIISNCINDGNIRMKVVAKGYTGAHNVGGIVRLHL